MFKDYNTSLLLRINLFIYVGKIKYQTLPSLILVSAWSEEGDEILLFYKS